ncbi:hypothetical protein AAY473_020244 [Plecturocebus cupreus]
MASPSRSQKPRIQALQDEPSKKPSFRNPMGPVGALSWSHTAWKTAGGIIILIHNKDVSGTKGGKDCVKALWKQHSLGTTAHACDPNTLGG